MRKTLRWVCIIVLSPIVIFLLLAVLLYLPPVQNWAVRQVTAYASDKTGMDISIGHVNLEFPLDLGLDEVKIIQQNDSLPQVKDTVAHIGHLVADVQLLPLFKKQVQIDEFDISRMKVNTTDFIHTVRIKGTVGHLSLQAHGIDLAKEHVKVDAAHIADSYLDIALSDTVPPDTTPSKNFWKVNVTKLQLDRTHLDLHLPGDTTEINAGLGHVVLSNAYMDLYKNLYSADKVAWKNGSLDYDLNYVTHVKGLDFNHLSFADLSIDADSFYYCDSNLKLLINQSQLKEQSGLAINSLTGPFAMDSTSLHLPRLSLVTPESNIKANVAMDLNAFADKNPGRLNLTIHGSVGKQDILLFAPGLPTAFKQRWPNQPLRVDGVLRGNLRHAHLAGVNLNLPTAFNVHANGFVANVTDPKRLKATLDLRAKTYDLGFVTAMLDPAVRKSIRIPRGIGFTGKVNVDGSNYASAFRLTQGGGSLAGKASVNTDRMAYKATLVASCMPLQHFVPGMGLGPFSGTILANGVGTDFLSPKTRMNARFGINSFRYSGYDLSKMKGMMSLLGGRLIANIDSKNKLILGNIALNATTNRRVMSGSLNLDLSHADLHNLRLTDRLLTFSGEGHLDWASDFKHYYKVKGALGNLCVTDSGHVYRPDDLTLDVLTRRDTTYANVRSGDFYLNMNARGGYERLLSQAQRLTTEIQRQMKDHIIDQKLIRQRLPKMDLFVNTGRDNMFVRALNAMGYNFDMLHADLSSSPVAGLNGSAEINEFRKDSILLDTIKFNVRSDSSDIYYSLQVRNNESNPQYVFNSLFDGSIQPNGTQLTCRIFDRNDKLGIGLGLKGVMEHNGIRLSITGDDPVLGYKKFSVNDGNYVFLGEDKRLSANLTLQAADGMGVQVYSNDEDSTALQDLTVSMHRFDLANVLSVVPYAPNVRGIMDGDFHAIMTKEQLTVSSRVDVEDMVYENCPMGNMGTEFVYSPSEDGTHKLAGSLFHDGDEVATLDGTYKDEKGGIIDATISTDRLPLATLNGFIPDQLFGFKGYADGDLKVAGSLSKPDINGELVLDSGFIFSQPYGVEMRFADDPVRIVGSHLLFENFEMFAHNDSPLDIAGSFDFSDTNNMLMDIRMRARNFLLIDSKKNLRSETFGKMYVNFFGMMKGPVTALKMGGKLDVLGSTDMTYILRDSPLSADNELQSLVTFSNFSDSTKEVVQRPQLEGFDMNLNVSIDEAAHIICMLDAEHTNYIDIVGGGDLSLIYNPVDEFQLRGKYTISSGEMKYSLPVIPLKTFIIQDGSYLSFQGDPFNPALNITATERTKASFSTDGQHSQMVDFDCGVVLTKTLNDMGLEFIIDAPENMTVSNQLNTMSKEERGKIAVTMLTTGMYIADGNTGSFSMNSALSAFLQSQINNISGRALQSLDLSFGVNNATSASGDMQTDYSFKFSKRFWNNRLNVQVGGKVSTGQNIDESNETFLNNVQFDYRLDQNSSKFLKLFYNRDSYDWLEGYVGKFGAGFVWKRQLRHFKDIFKFKDTSDMMPPVNDSSATKQRQSTQNTNSK